VCVCVTPIKVWQGAACGIATRSLSGDAHKWKTICSTSQWDEMRWDEITLLPPGGGVLGVDSSAWWAHNLCSSSFSFNSSCLQVSPLFVCCTRNGHDEFLGAALKSTTFCLPKNSSPPSFDFLTLCHLFVPYQLHLAAPFGVVSKRLGLCSVL